MSSVREVRKYGRSNFPTIMDVDLEARFTIERVKYEEKPHKYFLGFPLFLL